MLTHNPLKFILFLAMVGLVMFLFILDILTGPVNIPLNETLHILTGGDSSNPVWQTIVSDFRLPKAITALLAGAALSVSGLQMQTVFRNPLAGPYVLGISSGASLGVALVVLGFSSLFIRGSINPLSVWVQIVAAWIGAAAVMVLIMAVSLRVRDIMTILILGVLFGSAATAIVNILQYFSHQSHLKAFMVWSMGSLGNVTKDQLVMLAVTVMAGLLLAILSGKLLNVLLLGESYAKSMGLNLMVARAVIFISTSILTGSVTAFCGPIGFIGIAVPHLTRMIFKTADHRLLIPAVILAGGIVMLLSDLLSQIPGSDSVLPINSVTALIGIPVVIWIVFRNLKISAIK
ncbi:MAG: iron ABC transporter [Bacteroidetes bacterium RBG_13_46_8]|nr:MAG: iron ABC transporter [Bacteroidetes bacterium RBG_13_46_8]